MWDLTHIMFCACIACKQEESEDRGAVDRSRIASTQHVGRHFVSHSSKVKALV